MVVGFEPAVLFRIQSGRIAHDEEGVGSITFLVGGMDIVVLLVGYKSVAFVEHQPAAGNFINDGVNFEDDRDIGVLLDFVEYDFAESVISHVRGDGKVFQIDEVGSIPEAEDCGNAPVGCQKGVIVKFRVVEDFFQIRNGALLVQRETLRVNFVRLRKQGIMDTFDGDVLEIFHGWAIASYGVQCLVFGTLL